MGSTIEIADAIFVPRSLVCLLLAVLLDLTLREPSNRFHPVAWMGAAIARVTKRASASGWLIRLIMGTLLMAVGVSSCVLIGLAVDWSLSQLPLVVSIAMEAVLLKTLFSIAALPRIGRSVQGSLQADDLHAARRLVGYHLVSRNTGGLNSSELSAATIESMAENLSDSVVAPLLAYVVGGLPAVLAYRFVNTADAMIGYRTTELLWFGKTAARLDDLLNLIPARITAACMLMLGTISSDRPMRAFAVWMNDRRRTDSPNAGHTMSAAAGILGVRLEKENQYCLGSELPRPTPHDVGRMARLFWGTVALVLALMVIVRLAFQ